MSRADAFKSKRLRSGMRTELQLKPILNGNGTKESWGRAPFRRCTDDDFRRFAFTLTLLAFVICKSAGWAAQSAPLASLHSIHTLTLDQARSGLPVAFEATVTYYNPGDVDLFVQDRGEAVYVETKRGEEFAPGDRVLVKGKTRGSFTPDVLSDSVTVLHHGLAPVPVAANFEQLIRAERDCMWVSVRAMVRSADVVNFGDTHGAYLRLLMDGGTVDASIVGPDSSRLDRLLDAEVEVDGVVSGKFDSKMQLIGILLEVPSIADVKVLKRGDQNADSLPITPMNAVVSSSFVRDLTRRVRVKGTITFYQPGSAVVLQNGNRSIWISTHSSSPMRVGDIAEASGFPETREGFLSLADAEVQDTGIFEPIQAQTATWSQLSTWNSGDPDGHQNDLVSFEGVLAAAVREGSQDEYVLAADGKLFTAIYRHPRGSGPLLPMRQIPLGSRLRVTGICMAVQANSIDPSEQEVPFNILLRNFDDISIVGNPSPLNIRNLIALVGILAMLLIGGGVREWLRERKVRRETAAVAYMERRRGGILEEINGSRPLSEIIEHITELVSFKLRGAPCWCDLTDGSRLGNRPSEFSSFRITTEPIPAWSGPPLGKIHAAFHPLIKPEAVEAETLLRAASLSTLAIETRRLFSDLVHRSEFDILTNIHNRFSLEKCLDRQIEQAHESSAPFGLVYIDLNDFKHVNDVYGHHMGDLYLQEVAARMKNELRASDMLARLGGDEFAVLLPIIRNRDDVEDIARRIERCLDAPFRAEGYVIHGSASLGIATYPVDGTTKDSLLSAADAAMYVNKQTRRERRRSSGVEAGENATSDRSSR